MYGSKLDKVIAELEDKRDSVGEAGKGRGEDGEPDTSKVGSMMVSVVDPSGASDILGPEEAL